MTHHRLSYCGELLREHDPDRFLISMFAPADRRQALWALFAFHHEVAKTREVVSETRLGLIRLQWWRDAIGGVYEDKKILEHEIIKPLAAAIEAYDLPRKLFDDLIYAREFDLEDVAPAHEEGLMIYLDHSATPLLKLAMMICGDNPEDDAANVQSAAMNYALAGVLRAVPFHAEARRCFLPSDLMQKSGVRTQGDLYEFKKQDEVKNIIRSVSNNFVWNVKPQSKVARKLNALGEVYMKQAKRNDYNVFDFKVQMPPAFKALRLFFA